MHLTGQYPDWWEGRRWDRPVKLWAAGNSNETTRDNPQRILMGEPGEWGTGWIPKNCIVGEPKRARGIVDYIDTVKVRHVSGGNSILRFKAYEQGREKWQGVPIDGVWFDEEPPEGIYIEGLTRTNATGGFTMLTCTPLLGMTKVVDHFYPAPDIESRALVQMTLEDVDHYTDGQRAAIISAYPPHEREARTKGIPTLGSGAIFPIAESSITCKPFEIPGHWYQIVGLDFGWDHPTAAVHCAWDRDSDDWYVTNAYRQAEETPVIHASAVKKWGTWLNVAWPHDGMQHDKGSGEQLAQIYRGEGLRMLPEHATHPSGGFGVEAGVQEMLLSMQSGHFKVFQHLEPWFAEFRMYHRKEGKIVKDRDDLMAATRYAWMMKRFSTPNKRIIHPAFVGRDYDPIEGRSVVH